MTPLAKALVEDANALYSSKRLEQALEKYDSALGEAFDPKIISVIHFNKAVVLYVKGDYGKAIDSFTRALATDDKKLETKASYNLGNAYYKTGDINNAILNYERAKILAPQDKDIAFNLSLARQFVVTDIEELPQPFFVRWRNRILDFFPADTWSKISIGAFILFLILLGLFLFSKNISFKRLSFWIGIMAVFVSGLSYAFAAGQKRKIAMFRKSGLTDGELVCETIGKNMGAKIKSFNSKTEAVRWIKSKN